MIFGCLARVYMKFSLLYILVVIELEEAIYHRLKGVNIPNMGPKLTHLSDTWIIYVISLALGQHKHVEKQAPLRGSYEDNQHLGKTQTSVLSGESSYQIKMPWIAWDNVLSKKEEGV